MARVAVNSGMEIRTARLGDRSAIATVHRESVEAVSPGAYDEAALTVWAASIPAVEYAIEDAGTAFLVAEVDGAVAGFAAASLDDPELDKLYVAPSHQDASAGRALVDAVADAVRGRGGDSLYVEASVNAAPFYERVGFERVGTHEKAIGADGRRVEMTMVDLKKSL